MSSNGAPAMAIDGLQLTLDGNVPIPAALANLPVAQRLSEIPWGAKNMVIRASTGSGKTAVALPYEILMRKMRGEKVQAAMRQPTKQVMGFVSPMLREMWSKYGLIVSELNADIQGAAADSAVKADIVLISDGTLPRLRRMVPNLTHYVADEIHSPSLQCETDLALAKLKGMTIRLMSATVDPANLLDYLGPGTADIVLEGRSFPIERRTIWASPRVFARNEPEELNTILEQFCRRWAAEGKAGIVFLCTRKACDDATEKFADILPTKAIHGGESPRECEAWAKTNWGKPHAAFCTVAAATGVTLSVDEAVLTDERIDSNSSYGTKETSTVALDDCGALQQSGRVGRLRPGVAYLITNNDLRDPRHGDPWDNIRPRPIVAPSEKADSFEVILSLAAHGITRDEDIDLLGKPDLRKLAFAREWLVSHGCLEPDGSLTNLGRMVSRLPMETRQAHLILTAPSPKHRLAILAAFILGSDGAYSLVKTKPQKRNERKPRPAGFHMLPPEAVVAGSGPLTLAKLLQSSLRVSKDSLFDWCKERNLLAKSFFVARHKFIEAGEMVITGCKSTLLATPLDDPAFAEEVHAHLSRHALFRWAKFHGDTSDRGSLPIFADSVFAEAFGWHEDAAERRLCFVPEKRKVRNFSFVGGQMPFVWEPVIAEATP